jgi:RNA polymerase sigma-70 factor (family 1)
MSEYKVLYDTYYSALCLFSNKYLNDLELSKDVVQEVFLKVWQKQIVFENETAIKSYLYTSVKNKCLDFFKSKEYKSKRKLSEEDVHIFESQSYFEKELLLEEVTRMVDVAVNTLPFKCKEIISLSLKGLKNNQISEELSVSINTVKTQKRIAYQKLRPILKVLIST